MVIDTEYMNIDERCLRIKKEEQKYMIMMIKKQNNTKKMNQNIEKYDFYNPK